MKLPFGFGMRFVLRLVAPGALLAGVCLPATRHLAALIYPGLSDTAIFATSGLIFGFGLLLLDMPIYMLLEGRRYWPGFAYDWGVRMQARRLKRLRDAAIGLGPAREVELDILAAQYPIDRASGEPEARYPTRLGNLLASFETYPTVKYGLDGVFYWPRLWVAIDKELREELDSALAVVDGAIYCTFVFGVSALLCVAYVFFAPSSAGWHWPAGALACLILSGICYQLAIPRYAQYGDLFSAAFDQHRDKLKVGDFLDDLDLHMRQPGVVRTERETNRSTWRFLRWHRYRIGNANKNDVVKGW